MIEHLRSTDITLRDERRMSLSLEALNEALGNLSETSSPGPFVFSGGRRVPALQLVANALHVLVDDLRPTQALAALRELEFSLLTQAEAVDDTDEDEVSDLRTILGTRLHGLRGQWVAIQHNRVVANSVRLNELLRDAGDEQTTVLYVPMNGVIDAERGQS